MNWQSRVEKKLGLESTLAHIFRRARESEKLFARLPVPVLLAIMLLLLLFVKHSSLVPLVALETIAIGLLYYFHRYRRLVLVELTRIVPPQSVQGHGVVIKVLVNNRSGLSIFGILLEDSFPADKMSRKEQLRSALLEQNRRLSIEYPVACDGCFGWYELPAVALTLSDPLGFFRIIRKTGEGQRFLLLPNFHIYKRFHLFGSSQAALCGYTSGARGGLNPVFVGIREYAVGDSLRSVHWPSSARHNKLLVKEFELDARPQLYVLCDLFKGHVTEGELNSSSEIILQTAISVMHAASAAGFVASIAMAGEELLTKKLDSGVESFAQFLKWICEHRTTGGVSLDEVLALSAQHARPGDLALIVCSNLVLDEETLCSKVSVLMQRRIGAVALIVDEKSGELGNKKYLPDMAWCNGILRLKYLHPANLDAFFAMPYMRGQR